MNGNVLKQAISKRGFTQRQVATMMGMSPQNLSQKLASDDISTSLVEAVATTMGITPAALYDGGDHINATDHSMAFKGTNYCDSRLLDMIESRDKLLEEQSAQLTKCQEHVDRLLALIENQK